ncbi:hypothetical protein MHYP_G00067050 [Metynnis hypsauchen]
MLGVAAVLHCWIHCTGDLKPQSKTGQNKHIFSTGLLRAKKATTIARAPTETCKNGEIKHVSVQLVYTSMRVLV